jgi:hypothetical protein
MTWIQRTEAACRRAIRKVPTVRSILSVSLAALFVFLATFPLLLTKTSSLAEANSACWDLKLAVYVEWTKDMDEKEAREFLDIATSNVAKRLNPPHGLSTASAGF